VLETIPSKLQLPHYFDRSSCHIVCTRKSYPMSGRWLPELIHFKLQCRDSASLPPASFLDFLMRLGPVLHYYGTLLVCAFNCVIWGFMILPGSKVRYVLGGALELYFFPSMSSTFTESVALSFASVTSTLFLSGCPDVQYWRGDDGQIVSPSLFLSVGVAAFQFALLRRRLSTETFVILGAFLVLNVLHSSILIHIFWTLQWNFNHIISCSRTKTDLDLWNTVWFWTSGD
jgi:hypothetical protein